MARAKQESEQIEADKKLKEDQKKIRSQIIGGTLFFGGLIAVLLLAMKKTPQQKGFNKLLAN